MSRLVDTHGAAGTAESFAAVLQMRSDNLQQQQTRRSEYTSDKTFALANEPSFLGGGAGVGGFGATDVSGAGGDVVIELGAPMQDMQQEYAQSRAMSMHDVEESIGQLANVFAKLGELVSLQALPPPPPATRALPPFICRRARLHVDGSVHLALAVLSLRVSCIPGLYLCVRACFGRSPRSFLSHLSPPLWPCLVPSPVLSFLSHSRTHDFACAHWLSMCAD